MDDLVRIALVDDHPTLVYGLQSLFGEIDRYEVVAIGRSAADLVEIARNERPSVMVVDLSMPGDVFYSIREVRDVWPDTHVVVFTAYADVELAMKSIDAGAKAFVLKGRPSSELFDAVESVVAGNMYISPDFAPKLVTGSRQGLDAHEDAPRLSMRESQLIQLLLLAKTNQEMAVELSLSEKTIKHYMTNLMNKLKVKSRLEAVVAIRGAQRRQDAFGPQAKEAPTRRDRA